MTSQQISNATLTSNQTGAILTFKLVSSSGNSGFCNITVPRVDVPNGVTPTIYVDGQKAVDQGYVEDVNNFYVWCTTSPNAQDVLVRFVDAQSTSLPNLNLPVLAVTFGVIVAAVILTAVLLLTKHKKTPAQTETSAFGVKS
jgi:hypothetical protein